MLAKFMVEAGPTFIKYNPDCQTIQEKISEEEADVGYAGTNGLQYSVHPGNSRFDKLTKRADFHVKSRKYVFVVGPSNIKNNINKLHTQQSILLKYSDLKWKLYYWLVKF